MLVKIHNAYRQTVAICDSDLLGKKLSSPDGLHEVDLTGGFFKGEEMSDERVLKIIQDANSEDATFNIVGKRACELAKQIGLVKDSGIKDVEGVPVALVLL